MYVLGISCWYHDSAACLLRDGEIVAAASEERFSRVKHDAAFPRRATDFVLREAGIEAREVGAVAFYDKPILKFTRILESFVSVAPRGLGPWLRFCPEWTQRKLWVADRVRRELDGFDGPLLWSEHHESHAASAFYPSPFERAAVVTMDGVGEWTTTSIGRGEGAALELSRELRFPHSLGLLYSAFTYWLGFRVNSGEYKVMGLAPYGEPRFTDVIREHLIDVRPDGSFRLRLERFGYLTSLRMTAPSFDELFGRPRREPESPLEPFHADVARSLQVVVEEAMLGIVRHAHEVTGESDLCLAGGVALNCVGNGRVVREGPFERVWVQPAAGDAGGALGAALAVWHRHLGHDPVPPPDNGVPADGMRGSRLGPSYGDDAVRSVLDAAGARYTELREDEVAGRVAARLAGGRVVGWFQGPMEYGPRALGGRSILADPRSPDMQRRLNLKIKFRESFRPFAPAVAEEHAGDWFDVRRPSPYMLEVHQVAAVRRLPPPDVEPEGLARLAVPRSTIPAVTHVDGSARVQTVSAERSPRFHALLTAFGERTGCPVLVNTSFNVRGEPIVCTPQDALACFRATEMDDLVIGRFLVAREEQPPDDPEDVSAPAPAPSNESVRRARTVNLLGLVSPLANLGLRHVSPPELRSVGVVLGIALCALAGLAWWRGLHGVAYAALAAHGALVVAGLVHPRLPEPVARAWVAFGRALGHVVQAVLFTALFYVGVTPLAFVMRLLGKDPLERNAPAAESYWRERVSQSAERFERQF